MTKDQEKMYAPPTIELMEVGSEQGFAMSGYGSDSDDSEFGSYAYN